MYEFLKGVKVVELGHILLGPYAGQTLGDLGAEVIKVESLDGDRYRHMGVRRNSLMGAQWMNCNRNKRSIAIDLKHPEGKQVLLDLVRDADVFIHNMRPKAVEKLGFGYEALKAINPKLVYCFSSGFGQGGPYKDYPAFDDIIQAYSGIAAVNGFLDETPRYVPIAITDHLAGLMLIQAVQAGLYRQKSEGEGVYIEVPMLESAISVLMNQHLNGHAFEPPVSSIGYKRMLSAGRRPCKTADGYITHGVYSFRHWNRFLPAIGREDILNSELLADPEKLAENIGQLYEIMAVEILPQRTSDEWMTLFKELDIPCAPLLSLDDLEKDPHVKAVQLFEEYEHPSEGRVRQIRLPYTVQGVSKNKDMHPPRVGENSVEVLSGLGLDKAKIEQMLEDNVIAAPALDEALA